MLNMAAHQDGKNLDSQHCKAWSDCICSVTWEKLKKKKNYSLFIQLSNINKDIGICHSIPYKLAAELMLVLEKGLPLNTDHLQTAVI